MIAATPYFADRGCHVRIQGEAQALARRGVDVLIVTYGLGRDVVGARIARSPRVPGHQRLDAAPAWSKLVPDALLLVTALIETMRFRPDILHGHTQEGGFLAIVVGFLTRTPVVVDLQSRRVAEELVAYGKSGVGGLLFRIADFFDRWIPRHAAAVVTSTPAIAEFVTTEAAPRGPVAVVADGIDVPERTPARDFALAAQLGLDPSRPVLVYLGLLTEAQGVDLLLEALPHVRDAQLLLLGYPDEGSWRSRAVDLGVGDRVRVPGRVRFEDAPRHLALGDLALSAKRSTNEGNGKLLLYMSCGLPVVALDTATNREILGPDGLYAGDDPRRFALAIAAALRDRGDLAARALHLRQRAAARSWDAVVGQACDVYHDLARGRRA